MYEVSAHVTSYLSEAYRYGATHPGTVLFGFGLVLLLFRRKFKAALTLVFGVALCYANYFVFAEYTLLSLSLAYATAFAAVSIVLLLLLAFEFIQSA